jgi:hypothetical protein
MQTTTPLSTHVSIHSAHNQLQPYLDELHKWTTANQLQLNPDKCSATLFTPDPTEYATTLNLTINGVKIPTTGNPKILELTLDRKLTYAEHTKNAADKAKQLKALCNGTKPSSNAALQQDTTYTSTFDRPNRNHITEKNTGNTG